MMRPPRISTLFPYTPLSRSGFGMLFSRGSSHRQSQPVSLEVQPLPPGKPSGFDPGNVGQWNLSATVDPRSEEHTSELQSHLNLVCRLLLEKKNKDSRGRART